MHRTVRPALLAAVALVTLPLGASCSAAPPSTPTPPLGPSTESVAWVDGVCDAVRPFLEAGNAGPQIAGSDSTAAVRGFSEYYGSVATALDGTISGLGSAGPSPVAGGDEIVEKMTSDYTARRTALQDAKAKIDALDPADPQAILTVQTAQESLTTPDPIADLKANPGLSQAVDQAQNCRALPASGG